MNAIYWELALSVLFFVQYHKLRYNYCMRDFNSWVQTKMAG